MNKTYLYLILGIILIIIGIEQVGASSNHWHWALAPWLSGIIVLLGIYFVCKAWDKRKKK